MQSTYSPLRTLRDVEELERVPLEQRIFSWNLNDWIARGCARDPDKVAIRYVADGDPDSDAGRASPIGELRTRIEPGRQPVPFARRVGPTTPCCSCCRTSPSSIVVMLGALAAGIACCVNWMLKPEQLGELIRSTARQGRSSRSARRPATRSGRTCRRSAARFPHRCASSRCRVRAARRCPSSDLDTLAAAPAGRPARVRAQDRARRHRRLRAFRRHHRLAQAGAAHASRLLLQVLGQRGGDGAYRRRRDLRRLSDVPHRRHFRPRLFRDRARHVDRDPVAARRARQALHRELLEVRREDTASRSSPACRPRLAQLAKSRPQRREARLAARLCLHRLDRVSGRGRAPDREHDRRARAADLRRDRIHPERHARRRATAIRNTARPACACPTRRSRRSSSTATADQARLRASTRSAWWW